VRTYEEIRDTIADAERLENEAVKDSRSHDAEYLSAFLDALQWVMRNDRNDPLADFKL
jgi:hypothetical protein